MGVETIGTLPRTDVQEIFQQPKGRFSLSLPSIAKRICALVVPITTVIALANFPKAEALGGPETYSLPVCIGACITRITETIGGWGALIALPACKVLCSAGVVAF